MLRSIQAIAYSMRVQADRMNIVANNIANINTNAYKKEVVSVRAFNDVLSNVLLYEEGEPVGALGSMSLGSAIDQIRTVFNQGYLERSGFDTDFALQGNGFFAIETPNGTQYTRAGNFMLDQDGYLMTQNGNHVLGENNTRIRIPDKKLNVDPQGNIFNITPENETVFVNKLQIVHFEDMNQLTKTGNGYYSNNNPGNIKADGQSAVWHEYLESSNVDIVEETQKLVEAKRNFESCQQMIKMIDDTVGKAAGEIGRL